MKPRDRFKTFYRRYASRASPTTILSVSLLLLAATNVVVFGYQSFLSLTTPATFSYVEPFTAYRATNWSVLFDPITRPPYIITNFPPLYPVIVGLVAAVFDAPFFAGRLVSTVATLGTATLISLLVRRITDADWSVAVLASLLYVASPYVTSSGTIARPDNVALALGIGAVYWFHTRQGRSQILGAATLCLLTLFMKQSYLAAPAAVFLALVWRNQLRRAAMFATSLTTSGLLILGGLTVLTDGRAWRHLVAYNSNRLVVGRLIEMSYFFTTRHTALLVLGGVALFLCTRETPDVVVAYASVSAVLIGLTAKIGSNVLYFFQFIAAAAILAGIYLGEVFDAGILATIRTAGASAGVREVVVTLVLLNAVFLAGVSPPNQDRPGATEMADRIANLEGPIVAEDTGVLVASGHDVQYQPFLFGQLQQQGVWNQTEFVKSIRHREYRYAVMLSPANDTAGWFTPRQRAAVDQNYVLVERIGEYWLYEARANATAVPRQERHTSPVTPAKPSATADPRPSVGSRLVTRPAR